MDLLTDKEAEITVVVDPANGDALLVKGEAELNVTMDPSGKLSMTGRYLISDGNYNLSIGGLAKRKFTLQQGSYIQWTVRLPKLISTSPQFIISILHPLTW